MNKHIPYKKIIILILVAAMISGILLSAYPTPAMAETEELAVMQFEILDESVTIQDIFVLDETYAWAVGDRGEAEDTQPVIFLTTDGGESWVEVDSGISRGILVTVAFTDQMIGYAAGQDWDGNIPTLILRTEDGGQTWTKATLPQVFGSVDKVYFSESGVGWGIGFDFGNFQSLLLRSEDGINWVEQEHPSHEDAGLFGISFPSEGVGYAVGSYGWDNPTPYLIKTVDGGDTWTELDPPLEEATLSDVLFLDDQYGVAVGNSGELGVILVTEDGGSSWEISEFSGSSVYLKKILLYNAMLLVFGDIWEKDIGYKALILALMGKGELWVEAMRLNAKVTAVNQGANAKDVVLAAIKAGSTLLKKAQWEDFSGSSP